MKQRQVSNCLYNQLQTMQADLQLLPPRKMPLTKHQFLNKPCKLHTNLYGVSLKKTPSLQQYTIQTEPEIGDDGLILLRRLILSQKKQLASEIGMITSKGRILWSTKKSTKVISLEVDQNLAAKIEKKYTLLIKHTRSIAYMDILQFEGLQFRQIQHIYTVGLREKLQSMGLKQSTRNRFLQRGEGMKIKGYTILLSYELKLVPVMKTLNLLVDVGFRLLNQRNTLEQLQEIKNNVAKQQFAMGKVVVTMYNNKSYKIQKLCLDMNPKSSFFNQKRNKNMTFLQYFKEYYNITPTNLSQPLFQTTICVRFELQKGTNEKRKIQTKGYLIPQFCKFAATLNNVKLQDYHTFADIAKQIKIAPQIRKRKEQELIYQINNSNGLFSIDPDCLKAEGFIYQDIQVLGKNIQQSQNGMLKHIKHIKQPKTFQKNEWLFVYSNIKKSKQQYDFSDYVVDNLARASQYYGIKFEQPEFLQVNGFGIESWIQQMMYFKQDSKAAWNNIKVVIILLGNNQKFFYGQLKKFITNELNLPCQMLLKKTADSKNRASVFGKLALQINAKIGNTLWEVPPRHPFWKKKKLANGAFSISRNVLQQTKKLKQEQAKQAEIENRNSHVVGFVGTNSQNLSKVYANAKMISNQKQLQEIQTFQDIIADWLKNCKHVQGFMPEFIIIYREGMTEKQIKTQAKAQIQAFHKVINRARVKYVDYSPQLIYILVTKRCPKRIYRGEKAQGTGKFIPEIMHNPYPGTIVLEKLSSPHIYDFHLAAQATTQGTTTLTNYQIAYDASQIPEQAIAQFTMEQCYNYPNWQGGIKVPNCLQSADRLSRLVAEHIHQDIVDRECDGMKLWQLRNTPFYL